MDKDLIKESLSVQDVFDFISTLGGNPKFAPFGLLCDTICHNKPGEGSPKLYYYDNTKLFRCYTGCQETFDIFELTIKAYYTQSASILSLGQAIFLVAKHFNLPIFATDIEVSAMQDWDCIEQFLDKKHLSITSSQKCKVYDKKILNNFLYPIIDPWEKEGIAREVIQTNQIGYFPPAGQISIPHFDKEGNLVGIRGRFLSQEDAKNYGKYRPLYINRVWYSHPLGLNLYNLNNSKDIIQQRGTAIIYESEKSCLLHQTYFGKDLDFSVACCGSSVSDTHVRLLMECGAKEIVIAFDRQFQEINDDEFKHLTENLSKIYHKYNNYVNISIIFDKDKITSYKASPIDEGKEKFLMLFENRITHL